MDPQTGHGVRESSRRRRHREGTVPRVGVVRRKPRNRGMFGWFRQSAYNQKSPLIILLLLLVGMGVIAGVLWLMTHTPPTLPEGLK